jgi:hydrogenase 3 maturation protease
VAELLREKNFPGVTDCGTTPENHTAALRAPTPRTRQPSTLLIVDAADMGLAPGELRGLSIEELDAAAIVSHGVPLSLLLFPFADVFEIVALGIQPAATQLGAPLSEAVERAARHAVELIERGEWRKVQKL